MKFACLFGHKWFECKCERCGKERNAEIILCASPLFKCDVCNKTGLQIKQYEEEKSRRMQQMGVGLSLDMNQLVMFVCKKCNSFICSKCAIDVPDDFKKCPRCKASFDFDSIASDTKTPFAMLDLVKNK